jgi:methylenetetrahydrofolate reductase (NADPH)
MSILSAFTSKEENIEVSNSLKVFLNNFSIEVMPRTASKIESFNEILPEDTRIYIAHIEGVPIDEMVETAKRISNEGFNVMPHFPARIIKDKIILEDWINRYQGEAGIEQALLLAGGVQ